MIKKKMPGRCLDSPRVGVDPVPAPVSALVTIGVDGEVHVVKLRVVDVSVDT